MYVYTPNFVYMSTHGYEKSLSLTALKQCSTATAWCCAVGTVNYPAGTL